MSPVRIRSLAPSLQWLSWRSLMASSPPEACRKRQLAAGAAGSVAPGVGVTNANDIAEALGQLLGEAEDAGLDCEAIAAKLVAMAEATQQRMAE
jgi:hypothetical protein